jgi:hypothetical protein
MSIDLIHFAGQHTPVVGIVAGRCGEGTHTGIIYVHDGQLLICHQLWNYIFSNEPTQSLRFFPNGYIYSIPNLEPEQSNDIINWCRLISRRYIGPNIVGFGRGRGHAFPFAFRYDRDTTIVPPGSPQAGTIILTREGMGLTCSLFVLAVFDRAGIRLVDVGNWQPRSDDAERHRNLIRALRGNHGGEPLTEEDFRDLEAQIDCVRIRPEELIAACTQNDRPSLFEPTSKIGEWILKMLDTCPIPNGKSRAFHLGAFSATTG